MGTRRRKVGTQAAPQRRGRGPPATVPLDASARESIERQVRVLVRCGFSRPDISRELQSAAQGVLRETDSLARSHKALPAPSLPREITLASQVLSEWCTDPHYSDARGLPLALPKHGRRSVAALARRISRSLDVEQVLDYLIHTKAVQRSGRWYRVLSRWVSTRSTGGPNYLWSLRTLIQTLTILEHNLESQQTTPSWFHRLAERADVPLSKVAQIDRLVDRKGMAFLRWFDAYLHQCAAERRPGEPTVWYGIGLQRFESDSGPLVARQGRRSKRDPPKRRSRRRARLP